MKKKKTGGSITKDDNNVTKIEIKKGRKKKESETATENFNSSSSLFPLACTVALKYTRNM